MGHLQSNSDSEFGPTRDTRQDQQERETEELERELPVELSFLIRQQAFCMARMNYLDRQIRELKDAKLGNQNPAPQASGSSVRRTNAATTSANIKNGNFIPSDDSGGEYSRATMSDDDELSSLLDQIAKSVRPERNQPQQYAIINPNQIHHQAVPVFVMGSPIAVAHPSSISSTVPGVHFQPEPRYNQYYEDLHNGSRSKLDNSLSAIQQLISQKEKRQIKAQLKFADNWLKMHSSGLCNMNDKRYGSNITPGYQNEED